MRRQKKYNIDQIKEILGNPFGHIGEWLQTEKGSARVRIKRPSPFVGVAPHAGSRVRPKLLQRMAVSSAQRYLEEDPYTERFAELLPIAVIANDSRFEYDINRPPEKALYRKPEDAWGLTVWKEPPTEEEIALSLKKHAESHELMDAIAERIISKYGQGVVFDFHAFNRRRASSGVPTATDWLEDEQPEIDICTARINRELWVKEIELWKRLLGSLTINGVRLRVGECAVFRGGYLVSRMAKTHGKKILCLVSEIKKIYMDEVRGVPFQSVLEELVLKMGKAIEVFTNSFQEGSS